MGDIPVKEGYRNRISNMLYLAFLKRVLSRASATLRLIVRV